MFINEATLAFARRHADGDVRTLALQGTREEGVDLPAALRQIAGRQTARRKLPSWAEVDGIVYPPHLNMEQCSSEQTARYKAGVVVGLPTDRGRFVDLTGGFGVDFYWMSQGFAERIYVEQDEGLCALAEANMRALGHRCFVRRGTASAFLSEMERASVVYLDPARRNEHGGRAYGIADCSPNVIELLPLLKEKARFIVLKLSPMLDWRKAVSDLGCVSEVHIVSVAGECKELLLVLSPGCLEPLRVVCVNGASVIEFIPARGMIYSRAWNKSFTHGERIIPRAGMFWIPSATDFLYEPNASVMKAGCFEELEQRFAVRQVAQHSHLFLSSDEIVDFPGRRFKIEAVTSMNKRELGKQLGAVKQANISVRNFPLTAEQLRKKLRMKDGGDTYIFATTLQNGEHRLLICRKIG